MRLEDEYERNAREAQRMAENSKLDVDRAAWLRIAQHWLRMLLRAETKRCDKFNQAGHRETMTHEFALVASSDTRR